MTSDPLKAYSSVCAATNKDADAHRLIQLLLEGALNKIARAKSAIAEHNTAMKGEQISSAISIIDGLQASLDAERGGEVAANLRVLYDFCMQTLLEANLNNDTEQLDAVHKILVEIKAGWDAIRDEAQQILDNRS